MDFLIIIILSVLTPYSLNKLDIDYTTEAGVFYATNDKTGFMGTEYSTDIVKTGTSLDVLDITPVYKYLNTSVNFEMHTDVKIPIALDNQLWIAGRFAYNPSRDALTIRFIRSDGRGRPLPRSLIFNENPSIGGVIGYNLKKYTPNSFNLLKSGVAVYAGSSVLRLDYADAASYEAEKVTNTAVKMYAGASLQLSHNSQVDVQYTYLTSQIRGLPSLEQIIDLNVTRVNVGFTYIFNDERLRRKANKDRTYKNIFELL